MHQLTSIVLIVERSDQVHQALNKALVVARHFHARLELLLCEPERDSLFRPGHLRSEDEAGTAYLAEALAFLQALRQSIAAADIEIHSDAVYGGSLIDCLEGKIAARSPDLIVKGVELDAAGRSRIDATLVMRLSAPLLLTRSRSWHPIPRFAAAIDVLDERRPELPGSVLRAASLLRHGFAAQLEALYAQTDPSAEAATRADRELADVAGRYGIEPPQRHVVSGAAAEAVPQFVRDADADLLVLGRAQGDCSEPRHSSLQVLGQVACDVLVIGPPADLALIGQGQGQGPSLRTAGVT